MPYATKTPAPTLPSFTHDGQPLAEFLDDDRPGEATTTLDIDSEPTRLILCSAEMESAGGAYVGRHGTPDALMVSRRVPACQRLAVLQSAQDDLREMRHHRGPRLPLPV